MPELPSEREIVEAIGVKMAGMLKANTPGRICGLLTAKGRITEWERALEHISIHLGSSANKTVNSKFAKKFHDPEKLKEYIKRAAGAPSAVTLSRQTDPFGRPTGTPCLLILRDFKESIGEQADQSWLVIVADYQGKLVTAYPETERNLRQKNILG
jgi:hypothetical protein